MGKSEDRRNVLIHFPIVWGVGGWGPEVIIDNELLGTNWVLKG